MFAFVLVPAALLASQVYAAASPAPFSLSLFARQSLPTLPLSSIPEQCQSACKEMLDIGNTCATSSGVENCLCKQSVGDSFVACGNCVVDLPQAPASTKEQEQQALDAITSTCESLGHPFSKPLKVDGSSSGSSSSGSSSSSSGSSGNSSSSGALLVSPNGVLAVLSIIGSLTAFGI